MSANRINIDYKTTNYKQNSMEHQSFIKQEIADFNKYYNELCDYDRRSEWLIPVLGCGWFFGSLGTVTALFIAVTYLGMSHELFGRPEYSRQYQEQLNKLYDLFVWCIQSDRNSITNDMTFLELSKTILPFIEFADLKRPLQDWSHISNDFALLIVNDSLHRAQFLKERQVRTGGILSYLFTAKNQDSDDVARKGADLEGNTFNHRYNHAYAEGRFLLYGRQTMPPQSVSDKATQWLGPVKALVNYSSQ